MDKGGILGTGIGGPGPSKAPIGGVLGATGMAGTGLASVLGGASDKGEVLVCDLGGLDNHGNQEGVKFTRVPIAKEWLVEDLRLGGRGRFVVLSLFKQGQPHQSIVAVDTKTGDAVGNLMQDVIIDTTHIDGFELGAFAIAGDGRRLVASANQMGEVSSTVLAKCT